MDKYERRQYRHIRRKAMQVKMIIGIVIIILTFAIGEYTQQIRKESNNDILQQYNLPTLRQSTMPSR